MKTFASITFFAALVSLLSTTNADSVVATVQLQTTQCLQPVQLQTFTVLLNQLSPGVNTTCGIKVLSASNADVNTITCQAYKDTEGTILGSAPFNFTYPALIATNPVQEGSILCKGVALQPSQPSSNSTITTTTFATSATPTRNSTKVSSTSPPVVTFTGAASVTTGLRFAAGLAGLAALVLYV